MPTPEKETIIRELEEKLGKSQCAVLTDYRGLTVAQLTQMRRRMREASVEYHVVKNTLIERAARTVGIQGLEDALSGPTAVAFGFTDAVAPAKLVNEFLREYKQLAIKGGILEGKVIDVAGVKRLADLPPREVLLARAVGAIASPLTGFVTVAAASLRGLVTVLDALAKQRGEAQG